MNPQPKQIRQTDKAYLKWIRQQPCLSKDSDCIGDVVYHHTATRGAGGSDLESVPLCMRHHQIVHQIGHKRFQNIYGIDFRAEIIGLLKNYPKQNKQIVKLLKELEARCQKNLNKKN